MEVREEHTAVMEVVFDRANELRVSSIGSVGLEANRYFASNELAEAKLVANEVGFNSVVVRFDPATGEHHLIYDAALNTDVALAP